MVIVVNLTVRLVSIEMSVEVSDSDIKRIQDMIAKGDVETLVSYLRDLGVNIGDLPKDVALIRVGDDYILTHAPVFG